MGFYVAFNSLGHISMRQKPGTGKKFPSHHKEFQGVFQFQKGHRQPSTMPHIYKATRPTRLEIQRNLEPAHAWETGILTTRPGQIPGIYPNKRNYE